MSNSILGNVGGQGKLVKFKHFIIKMKMTDL